jgi:glycosyltransferase involved in cell wall biosynthesis
MLAPDILAESMGGHESDPLPKRLLHLVASISPQAGGTTEAIRRLAQSGVSEGEVVSLDDPGEAYVREAGFPIHALGPPRGGYRYTPNLQRWLHKNLDRFDGAVIHGLWQWHSYGSYRLLHGRLPYIVFPHGMLDPYFKRAFPFKHAKKQVYWFLRERHVLRHAKAVCFTTEIERRSSEETFWPHTWRPAVVSLGIAGSGKDRSALRRHFLLQYPQLKEREFLLFLSRIHRKKGTDLLLQAFAQVAGDHRYVDLVIAGPDEEGLRPQLEAQAARLGISDRVHYTGMIEGDVKWGALYAAKAFVLPSHQENFGVAVVEAMAAQVPVLISDKVNIWPELAADAAGIINPDTAEGTLRSLTTLLSMSEESRQQMISNALACFHNRYEITAAARSLQALF